MAQFLPILTFHALDDQRSVISFPPELFRRGMARLFEIGYRTISLLEAVDSLRLKKPFPDRSFVITFDDGYRSVYDVAFPILQDFRMTATIFLTVGGRKGIGSEERLPSLGGRLMLNWHEILEMRQGGIEFGAHTLTHPDLTCLPLERVKSEILDSKVMIENALSDLVKCFAAPFSRYDHRSLEIIRRNFTCACTDTLGLVNLKSDLYGLERIDTYYFRTERLFNIILTPLFPWYIQLRSIPRGIRRFIQKSLKG
jgi:peptidoglycan/xylan/chitin deacetylase (PgdA/CDA1 family)